MGRISTSLWISFTQYVDNGMCMCLHIHTHTLSFCRITLVELLIANIYVCCYAFLWF